MAWVGGCSTSNGTSLILDGTRTTPGSDNTHNAGHTTPEAGAPSRPPETWTPEDFAECVASWGFRTCYRGAFDDDPETEDDEPGIPPITITDLAQFTPPPTLVVGEPDNVGIAGMPTNFVATASATTQSGTLFGFPVSVRFTPSAYVFHYGDGAETTTDTGGRTWADLGQAQFTPTATSHVYADRGTYQADVDVRYTAEIDLGFGWFPVRGELTADGPTQEIRIFEARTALVAYTCDQRPDSPGC